MLTCIEWSMRGARRLELKILTVPHHVKMNLFHARTIKLVAKHTELLYI